MRETRRATASSRCTFDASGRCSQARFVASPNADQRPAGARCELIVIHNISLPPGVFEGDAVERFFTNRLPADAHPYFERIARMRVSAHFFLRRDGELVQFVECDRRAWHAGVSQWGGREHCNDFSIGIEVEGGDAVPYTDAQYAQLARLVRALARRYPISGIAGHEHIAQGRKTDPGPAFDWSRLRRGTRLAAALFAQTPVARRSPAASPG